MIQSNRERKEKRERKKKNRTKIVEYAKIAEQAGACCLIVSDPSQRGISRMPDLSLIKEIKCVVLIPIMVRARVGHFIEAQILEAIGVNYMDESEAIALTNEDNFINKQNFRCPFVSRCENLREALSRVREGAAMIVEAVFCV